MQEHPIYKLILIANRDEQYKRSTQRAHFWEDSPDLFAGRDLQALGTWMGITKQGRFAALTNYRNPGEKPAPASRGNLVASYLKENCSPETFLTQLQENRSAYKGFNLLIGSADTLYFYNKEENKVRTIEPGTHSVSNASLNTPWPKVVKARKRLHEYVQQHHVLEAEDLFSQLHDETPALDAELPDTGVNQKLEKQLSSIFIRTDGYGTRSSTVLLVTHDNEVTFHERTFQAGKQIGTDIQTTFQIEP